MMTVAMGILLSAPGPKESAAGIAPAIVATDVINMGLKRMGQASRSALRGVLPLFS